MLQGYDSLYYGYSSLDGSVVVRILKVVLKEFNMSRQSVVYRVIVCVSFSYWLLTCVSITRPPSQQSLRTVSVSCRMPLSREDEKKMLPDLKKPQGPVRYRPQIAKHVPEAIFYLWYNACNLKLTNLTILSGQFRVKYIHIVVQPSSRAFFFFFCLIKLKLRSH